MNTKAFRLGALIFLITLLLDGWVIYSGLSLIGIFLCIGTILVFAAGIVWLIYQDDGAIHFRSGWLVLPLALFGAGLSKVLSPVLQPTIKISEALPEMGNLLMSRYQLALWIVSLITLTLFVTAASVLARRRT